MLVLSRKSGESIMVGSEIEIKVISANNNRIKIGIQAPEHIRIVRSELAPPRGHDFPVVVGNLLEAHEDFGCYELPVAVLPR